MERHELGPHVIGWTVEDVEPFISGEHRCRMFHIYVQFDSEWPPVHFSFCKPIPIPMEDLPY